MNPIKVFIVDDHKLFIEGLYALLSDEQCLDFIGYSMSPAKLVEEVQDVDADVFLIDINMPEMSGIALTKLLMAKRPDAKILALTMFDDYKHIEKMIASGAIGYSLKSDNITELIKAIKTVAQGKKFISESIQEAIVNRMSGAHELEETEDVSKSKLTMREIEVLLLIIKEVPKNEIAERLFISPRTVETHRKNICAKANARSPMSLLKYAIREGIVEM